MHIPQGFLIFLSIGLCNSVEFLGGNYSLIWNYDAEGGEIRFVIDANTTGYVGLGIQSTAGNPAGMKDADIFHGWITPTGILEFRDSYSVNATGTPTEDAQNDWSLIEGCQIEGRTHFVVSRKFVTEDEFDVDVEPSMNILVAFGSGDSFTYHGGNREKQALILSGGSVVLPDEICPPPNTPLEFIDGKYKLQWVYDAEAEEITIAIDAETEGYIAIGFQVPDVENNGMRNADIFYGWVTPGGNVVHNDTYSSNSSGAPSPDGQNDWNLIEACQFDGTTHFTITRKFVTDDDTGGDIDIIESMNVLAAFGSGDAFVAHGVNREKRLINLREEGFSQIPNICPPFVTTTLDPDATSGPTTEGTDDETTPSRPPNPEIEFIGGDFRMQWVYDTSAEIITIYIRARTNGYIALGFQVDNPSNVQMKNSDIFSGWVTPGGRIEFYDSYSEADLGVPRQDVKNDWNLIEACQFGGWTHFMISRKFVTDDKSGFDVEIIEAMNVLVAFGDQDAFTYHGINRDKRFLNLREGSGTGFPDNICIPIETTTEAPILPPIDFIDGKYTLQLEYDADKEEISFVIDVETSGYVALGLQKVGDGGMLNADIFAGWVDDNGIVDYSDYYSNRSAGRPLTDDWNDWELIEGCEIEDRTHFIVKRKWITEDETGFDVDIEGSMNILAAFGPEDELTSHGGNRQKKLINLSERQAPIPPKSCQFPPNTTVDFIRGKFRLEWVWDDEEEILSIYMNANTEGFLALGFQDPSDNGMRNADLLHAWVNPTGSIEFHDYYSEGGGNIDDPPRADLYNDWVLIEACEFDGVTHFSAYRKFVTGRLDDVEITETMHVLAAFGPDDAFAYHGENSDKRLINLREGSFDSLPDGVCEGRFPTGSANQIYLNFISILMALILHQMIHN